MTKKRHIYECDNCRARKPGEFVGDVSSLVPPLNWISRKDGARHYCSEECYEAAMRKNGPRGGGNNF